MSQRREGPGPKKQSAEKKGLVKVGDFLHETIKKTAEPETAGRWQSLADRRNYSPTERSALSRQRGVMTPTEETVVSDDDFARIAVDRNRKVHPSSRQLWRKLNELPRKDQRTPEQEQRAAAILRLLKKDQQQHGDEDPYRTWAGRAQMDSASQSVQLMEQHRTDREADKGKFLQSASRHITKGLVSEWEKADDDSVNTQTTPDQPNLLDQAEVVKDQYGQSFTIPNPDQIDPQPDVQAIPAAALIDDFDIPVFTPPAAAPTLRSSPTPATKPSNSPLPRPFITPTLQDAQKHLAAIRGEVIEYTPADIEQRLTAELHLILQDLGSAIVDGTTNADNTRVPIETIAATLQIDTALVADAVKAYQNILLERAAFDTQKKQLKTAAAKIAFYTGLGITAGVALGPGGIIVSSVAISGIQVLDRFGLTPGMNRNAYRASLKTVHDQVIDQTQNSFDRTGLAALLTNLISERNQQTNRSNYENYIGTVREDYVKSVRQNADPNISQRLKQALDQSLQLQAQGYLSDTALRLINEQSDPQRGQDFLILYQAYRDTVQNLQTALFPPKDAPDPEQVSSCQQRVAEAYNQLHTFDPTIVDLARAVSAQYLMAQQRLTFERLHQTGSIEAVEESFVDDFLGSKKIPAALRNAVSWFRKDDAKNRVSDKIETRALERSTSTVANMVGFVVARHTPVLRNIYGGLAAKRLFETGQSFARIYSMSGDKSRALKLTAELQNPTIADPVAVLTQASSLLHQPAWRQRHPQEYQQLRAAVKQLETNRFQQMPTAIEALAAVATQSDALEQQLQTKALLKDLQTLTVIVSKVGAIVAAAALPTVVDLFAPDDAAPTITDADNGADDTVTTAPPPVRPEAPSAADTAAPQPGNAGSVGAVTSYPETPAENSVAPSHSDAPSATPPARPAEAPNQVAAAVSADQRLTGSGEGFSQPAARQLNAYADAHGLDHHWATTKLMELMKTTTVQVDGQDVPLWDPAHNQQVLIDQAGRIRIDMVGSDQNNLSLRIIDITTGTDITHSNASADAITVATIDSQVPLQTVIGAPAVADAGDQAVSGSVAEQRIAGTAAADEPGIPPANHAATTQDEEVARVEPAPDTTTEPNQHFFHLPAKDTPSRIGNQWFNPSARPSENIQSLNSAWISAPWGMTHTPFSDAAATQILTETNAQYLQTAHVDTSVGAIKIPVGAIDMTQGLSYFRTDMQNLLSHSGGYPVYNETLNLQFRTHDGQLQVDSATPISGHHWTVVSQGNRDFFKELSGMVSRTGTVPSSTFEALVEQQANPSLTHLESDAVVAPEQAVVDIADIAYARTADFDFTQSYGTFRAAVTEQVRNLAGQPVMNPTINLAFRLNNGTLEVATIDDIIDDASTANWVALDRGHRGFYDDIAATVQRTGSVTGAYFNNTALRY